MNGNSSPMSGRALILLTLSLGLGTFIQILDTSIANVVVPTLAKDQGVSPQQGTWVITSFAVSNAIVLPLTGWLANRFGGGALFAWSTALFSVASFLCGAAWNFPMLVFFRVVQGAVGGCLIPLSQSLLLTNFPKEKKGLALGFWSMIVVVAPMLGPIIGGWIADNYGWRWIFYINIPFGMLSSFLSWRLLRERENKKGSISIDLLGLSLLTIGIGSLQIFLDQGNSLGWFDSEVSIVLSSVALLALSLFMVRSFCTEYPVVDFSFFRNRNFLIATVLSALGYFVVFGSTVLIPLWLQTQMGYSAYLAGLAVMPIGIIPIFLTPLIGWFMRFLSLRAIGTASFMAFACTCFWFSTFTTDVSIKDVMMPRFIQGLGIALFFIPLLGLALSEVKNEKLASASGVYNFIRLVVGGGAGTALYVTFWDKWAVQHYSDVVETVNSLGYAARRAFVVMNDLKIEREKMILPVDKFIEQQSYLLAFDDLMWISGWLFVVLIPFLWLCGEPSEAVKK